MMNMILSEGSSSRLNKNLVEKKQIAMAAFSFAFDLEDPGLGLIGGIGSAAASCSDLEKAMDEEIALMQKELISEEEFQKVRTQIENNLATQNASVAGVAENLAENFVYFGSTEMVNKQLEKYMSVTREDILRVAKKYLTQDKRVILHYLPKQ
jgi:predicted Zn-dependent peptidase